MAIAVTLLTSGNDPSITTVAKTTASISAAAGDLLLVAAVLPNGTASRTATVTGTGLTWSKVTSTGAASMEATWDSGSDTISWHRCIVPAGGFTGTLTITQSGSIQQMHWFVLKVTGHDGTNPVPQRVAANGTGTTGSATLAAPVSLSSRSFYVVAHHTFENENAGTGFTEIDEQDANSPATGCSIGWSDTAWSANPSATWTTSSLWGMMAIEVAAAAGGASYNESADTTGTATTGVTDALAHAETLAQTWNATTGVTDSLTPAGGAGFTPGATTTYSTSGSGSQNNVDLPIPAHSVGDLLIAAITLDNSGAVVNIPTGWSSPAATDGSSGGHAARVIYRIVDGSEGYNTAGGSTQNVTFNGFFAITAVCHAIDGADATTPIDAFGASTGLGGTPTAPSVTAIANSRRILFGCYNITGTGQSITGYTKQADVSGTSSTRTETAVWTKNTDQSAGATGTEAVDNGSFTYWVAYSITLKPGAAGNSYNESADTVITSTTGVTETAQRADTLATTGTVTTGETDQLAAVNTQADTWNGTTGETDALAHPETLAQTWNATTGVIDGRALSESLSDTWAGTTGVSDALAHPETIGQTWTGTTGLTDALAHSETLSDTWNATTGETDARAQAETLVDVWNGTTGVTDSLSGAANNYNEQADTTGTVTTGLLDALAHAETLANVIAATTGLTDALAHSELLTDVWNGTTGVTDVRALFEALATTGTMTTGLTGVVGTQEQCSLVIVTTTGCIDSLAASQALSLVILATTEVTDQYVSGSLTPLVIMVAVPFTTWQTGELRDPWSTGQPVQGWAAGPAPMPWQVAGAISEEP